ncbi:PhoH family protein [Ructibacterium gallinarum]|uniref:PhoH-like protein n=1 Tax=Ructibacterium gallinarum TaxID=2779355 RepID=A0A9D5M5X3_9FIRM|nr:PhoH family protein [Ructibacterium gallinarum]MBE5040067.1 PhoH family protein [Ructibacterium gallinarum]
MERMIETESMELVMNLFGSFDANVKLIEKELQVSIINRGTEIKVTGEPNQAEKAISAMNSLISMARRGENIGEQEVRYVLSQVEAGNQDQLEELGKDVICITARGVPVKAKTLGQKQYVQKIEENSIVFGIGPAGTGKTYLAVAAAVAAFKRREVDRIILTRPAIEAGESLGFLPGDMQEKVDPYLRPLYDALGEMLGFEVFQKNLERGLIEVAPLAYMRGRTLDNAFIILDEAQNTTPEQMKMFLTRMGFSSRIAVTGDITQIDLPRDKRSGLKDAEIVLKNVEGIAFVYLDERDVVRHPLVQRIVKAYERRETERERAQKNRQRRENARSEKDGRQ